jgi:signal transduction histidine kinase
LTTRTVAWLGGLGAILCAGAAAVALGNTRADHPGLSAALAAITIAALFGVGIYSLRHGPSKRFGALLIATGCSWFLSSLSNSDVALLYSVGRVSTWIVEVLLIYALLSYPTGRLNRRPERAVVAVAVLTVLFLYLSTAPLVREFPTPAAFNTCTSHCPSNSFFIAGSQPGVVDSVIRPLRDVLTIGVYLATTLLLVLRISEATRSLRRTLTPVLGAAAFRFAAAVAFVALRRAGASVDVLHSISLIVLLSIPAMAVGFFVGFLRWRVYSADALTEITLGLHAASDPGRLRGLLAGALGDRSLRIYYRLPGVRGGWRDTDGVPVAMQAIGSDRCVAEIANGSGPAAALVCDGAFRDHMAFLQAVGSCALAALEQQRLSAALSASLHDVEASRNRLAAAAVTARQQIERDLHDGAQQQLVTLRVKLELAREAIEQDPANGGELLDELGPEVEEIIEEVRSLARGIYPQLLGSEGLAPALRAAARRGALPVSVSGDGSRRYTPEVEGTVYFCCLEALQNVSKHAGGATKVTIGLGEKDNRLQFEVSDDGEGYSPADEHLGSGVTGMRDRLAAIGGELRIESQQGVGTRVIGTVPLS